jgi:hypothetical protein
MDLSNGERFPAQRALLLAPLRQRQARVAKNMPAGRSCRLRNLVQADPAVDVEAAFLSWWICCWRAC